LTFSLKLKRTSIIVRRFAILVVLLVVLALGGALLLVRPLLKSDDYSLVASIDGSPAEAQLLEPFPWGPYYINLATEPTKRYNWFGVAFGRESVFIPIGIYRSRNGWPYIHADQAKGVRLTDGKVEDNWTVDFTDGGVTFSNASIHVELHKK
jgi:hypothetical protein